MTKAPPKMERGIAQFALMAQKQHNEILRDATQRVSNSLVRLTPVDTGEAVADWDSAIGNWPADTQQPDDPRKTKTRRRLQAVFKDVKFGQSVFFENDDPVAVKLEYGYSKKAPQGMVRMTTRRWKTFVRGAAQAATKRIGKQLIDG